MAVRALSKSQPRDAATETAGRIKSQAGRVSRFAPDGFSEKDPDAAFSEKNLQEGYDAIVETNIENGMTLAEAQNDADSLMEPAILDWEIRQSGASAMSREIVGAGQATSDTGIEANKGAIRFATAMFGGMLGSGAGANISANPQIARAVEKIANPALRWLARRGVEASQFVGEIAGVFGGDIAGRAITGEEQNLAESMTSGLIGGGSGAGFRGLTKVIGGFVGGAPRGAIADAGVPTAGIIPSIQKVARPLPRTGGQISAGISNEIQAVPFLQRWASQLDNTVTQPRLTKVGYIDKVTRTGVGNIDPQSTIRFMLNERPQIPMDPNMTASFTQRIEKIAEGMRSQAAARGGVFSPKEWDTMINETIKPLGYKGGSQVESQLANSMRKVKFHMQKELHSKLPADVRELDIQITNRINDIDDAVGYFGSDNQTVLDNFTSVHKAGGELRARALMTIEDFVPEAQGLNVRVGNVRVGVPFSQGIVRKATTASTRRSFTTDPRGENAGGSGAFAVTTAKPLEFVGQAMAPFQPTVGPAIGAASVDTPLQDFMGNKIRTKAKEGVAFAGDMMLRAVKAAKDRNIKSGIVDPGPAR